ncbi:MAG: holo-ACP synthase [Cellulosilyticaceae bacterium]
MIIGIGTDIIEISRVKQAIERNEKFKQKLFTEKEQSYFEKVNNRVESIAGNFAAKEAISKALGTGFRKFGMEDIEILRDGVGKPSVVLLGGAKVLGDQLGIESIMITISHCKEYAVAFAVAEGRDRSETNN